MLQDITWRCMTLNDVVWSCMTLYDVVWCCMMLYDVLWCSMIFYDVLWCSMMFYDVLWCSMMFYDFLCLKSILSFLLSERTCGVSPVIFWTRIGNACRLRTYVPKAYLLFLRVWWSLSWCIFGISWVYTGFILDMPLIYPWWCILDYLYVLFLRRMMVSLRQCWSILGRWWLPWWHFLLLYPPTACKHFPPTLE